jgi:hypothetical protein
MEDRTVEGRVVGYKESVGHKVMLSNGESVCARDIGLIDHARKRGRITLLPGLPLSCREERPPASQELIVTPSSSDSMSDDASEKESENSDPLPLRFLHPSGLTREDVPERLGRP